jgi:hypothetical protein
VLLGKHGADEPDKCVAGVAITRGALPVRTWERSRRR